MDQLKSLLPAIPPVPDWLKLFRVFIYVTSFLALLIHLTAFSDQERERHHRRLVEFTDTIRGKAAGLLTILTTVASGLHSALRGLYGHRARVPLIAYSLAALYLVIALVAWRAQHPDLAAARQEKIRLEHELNPYTKHTTTQLDTAFAATCMNPKLASCGAPANWDDTSVTIRSEAHNFGPTWSQALRKHQLAEELAMLTLLHGHPTGACRDPATCSDGPQWARIGSVFAVTGTLDLITILIVLWILDRMARATSSIRVLWLTAAILGASTSIGLIAFVAATGFLHGETSAYILLFFELPIAAGVALISPISVLIAIRDSIRDPHGIDNKGQLAASLLMLLFSAVGWIWLGGVVVQLRAVVLGPLDSVFAGIMAAAAVAPAGVVCLAMLIAWAFRLGGGAILSPVAAYLTVAYRVNKSVAIGLLSLPAALLQAVYSAWEYLAQRHP